MKISKIGLIAVGLFITSACGSDIDQNEIHKINDQNYIEDTEKGEGFGLSGPDMETIKASSSLSSSSNNLTCNANGDGVRTIDNFDFRNMPITVEISSSANNMEFGIETSSNHYYFMKKQGGVVVSYEQLNGGSPLALWDATYGKYLKIENQKGSGYNRVHFYTSSNGSNWTGVGVRSFTGSNTAKLVYKCGPNSTTIRNVKVDGVQQDLSLSGGSGGGGSGSGGSGGSGGAATTPYTSHSVPGKIQFEHFDNSGSAAGFFDTSGGNSGGQLRSTNVDIQGTSDAGGGHNVGWTAGGEWLLYTLNSSVSAGDYDLKIRHAGQSNGSIRVRLGSQQLATISLPATGGWQNWTTTTVSVNAPAGQNQLKVELLSGGFNLNWMEFISSGSGGGGSGSGGSGSGNIANHPNYSFVLKAHNYFESVKRQSNNPSVYTLKTYKTGDGWAKAADVYDNGIAAIAYTVMGRANDAGIILRSYLDIYQGLEDWGNANGIEKKLLTQRVYTDTLSPNVEIEPAKEDLGNNSYMMLALCKYYNQFRGDGASSTQLLPYYDRAYKILDYIWRTRRVTAGLDRFEARLPPQNWASTEHHINLYAFGKCMQQHIPSGQGYSSSRINNFTNLADNFVRAMWDNNVGVYRIGTSPGTDAVNYGDGIPADTASWRYLSGAGFMNATNDGRSLDYLTSSGGHWVQEYFLGINPFYGVRFTSNQGAYGSQIENTGAALAALRIHGGYTSKANKIENSLKKLWNQRGNNGLPSHRDNPASQGCCNTGLSWSYYNVSHTASNAYSILGLIGENPYSPTKSGYTRVQNVVIP